MHVPHTSELYAVAARRAAAARRRGRASLQQRWRRLRERLFFITQIAVSAALAWFIAGRVLGHPSPFFAPVAAVVALGFSFGQRIERAVQIVLGVAVGVLVGDLVVSVVGSGYWQLALIVFASMAIMTLVDGRVLTTIQAGLQSAMVTILVAGPNQAFSRWIDAVVGGLVALVAATITPAAPLRRPRQHTSEIVRDVSDLFAETAAALRERDLGRATAALDRARDAESMLDTLKSLADDGLAVIRSSPFRRGHLPAVQEIADLHEPLERAMRNLRVLIRRATIALRQGESVPKNYIDMVSELADVTAGMADDLGRRELPAGHRAELYRLAEATTYVTSRPTLSSEVIRAQVRSIVLDLLMVSGLPFEEAMIGIPSSYSLHGEEDEILGDDFDGRDDEHDEHDDTAGRTVGDSAQHEGLMEHDDIPVHGTTERGRDSEPRRGGGKER